MKPSLLKNLELAASTYAKAHPNDTRISEVFAAIKRSDENKAPIPTDTRQQLRQMAYDAAWEANWLGRHCAWVFFIVLLDGEEKERYAYRIKVQEFKATEAIERVVESVWVWR